MSVCLVIHMTFKQIFMRALSSVIQIVCFSSSLVHCTYLLTSSLGVKFLKGRGHICPSTRLCLVPGKMLGKNMMKKFPSHLCWDGNIAGVNTVFSKAKVLGKCEDSG
jgi:hypothetical protein